VTCRWQLKHLNHLAPCLQPKCIDYCVYFREPTGIIDTTRVNVGSMATSSEEKGFAARLLELETNFSEIQELMIARNGSVPTYMSHLFMGEKEAGISKSQAPITFDDWYHQLNGESVTDSGCFGCGSIYHDSVDCLRRGKPSVDIEICGTRYEVLACLIGEIEEAEDRENARSWLYSLSVGKWKIIKRRAKFQRI
jgi:hypothetical protein